jgi:alpha-L-arabinofuranosidase
MNFRSLSGFFAKCAALPLAALLSGGLGAQTPTNIQITNSVIRSGVNHLGMNIGGHNFYDSGQIMKNLIFKNPGFEPQMFQSTVRCASGTATSCTGENSYVGWPAGYWNGGTYQVISGAAAGRTGKITTSTAPVNGSIGVVFTFDSSGTAPTLGDYMIIRQSVPGHPETGWWVTTSGKATTSAETSDLPSGTQGVQCMRVTSPASGDSATVAQYFDSMTGLSFVQLNGTFQLTFKAKGAGGNNNFQVHVYRSNGGEFIPNQTIALSSSWNNYSLTFTAAETGSSIGTFNVVFTAPGPTTFLLDDVSLQQTDSSPSNTSPFRDAVVNTLKAYSPGTFRYWDSQLGERLDNWIAPPFGRKPVGYSPYSTTAQDVSIGLHEFLQLCQNVNTEPWVVIPVAITATEASNLIEYLAGSSTSTYGAKRAARGQTSPWTSVFKKIHIEFGNEAWNSTFDGGNLPYPDVYGSYANVIFGAMRTNTNFQASAFDLIAGGQEVNLGLNQTIVGTSTQHDTFTVGGYISSVLDTANTNEDMYGPLFAEVEQDNASMGILGQNRPLAKNLAVYELNMDTISGAASQSAVDSFVPSEGGGLAIANHMLMMMRDNGVMMSNIWSLAQYSFARTDGKQVKLYGTVVDMGGATNHVRPQFQAAALANEHLAGNMLSAVQSGANPTWNQSLKNGVQWNNAHYIQSYAYQNGNQLSVILFNVSRSSALPVTFSGVNAPQGTVIMEQLSSTNITDNNESSQKVNTVTKTLSNFNPATSFSLPAYSMTVLTWTSTDLSNVTVTVSPTTATVAAGKTQQFTATVTNSSDTSVTWSISPQVGSISSSGLYTAPSTVSYPQTVLVTAASVSNPAKMAVASVTLTAATTVAVSPGTAQLIPGQTQQFSAVVQNSSNQGVNWSISPNVGSITTAGLYTAPGQVTVQQNVTVTATSQADSKASGTALITLKPGGNGQFSTIAVNSGGPVLTDSAGLQWVADTGSTGGNVASTTHAISGTSDPAIYQTYRFGTFSYAFTLPNGSYAVTLKFTESFWTTSGKRVFNVIMNGQTVLSNFDVYAAAGGQYIAVDRTVNLTISGGNLVIGFTAISDMPMVSGIEIVQTDTPVALNPASVTLQAGQSQQFQATGGSGAYNWVLSPSVGTLSPVGLYTAPSSVSQTQIVSVTASSSDNSSNYATSTVTVAPTQGTGIALAVNSGGAAFTDPRGFVWQTDYGYDGSGTLVVTAPISGTNVQPLYQSQRYNNTFTYTFSVANGKYNLTLRFAELYWSSAGKRIFNVTVNGTQVLTGFDIFAAAGAANKAIDKAFPITVSNSQLTIKLQATTDLAAINGILLTPQH